MAKQELIDSPYQLLEKSEASKAIRLTQELRKGLSAMGKSLLDTAATARLIHELFETKRGGFKSWYTYENIAKTTVYDLMAVDRMLNIPTIGTNSEHLESVDITALYQLAKPSTPEPAISEVIKHSKAGKHLSVSEVRKIIKRHKSPSTNGEVVDGTVVSSTPSSPLPEQPAKPDTPVESIPKSLAGVFEIAGEMEKRIRELRAVLKWFTEDHKTDKACAVVDANAIGVDLRNAIEAIKVAMPHKPCPRCKGRGCKKQIKGQITCDDRGWLTVEQWKATPEEYR